jgi:hypothetical protein
MIEGVFLTDTLPGRTVMLVRLVIRIVLYIEYIQPGQ